MPTDRNTIDLYQQAQARVLAECQGKNDAAWYREHPDKIKAGKRVTLPEPTDNLEYWQKRAFQAEAAQELMRAENDRLWTQISLLSNEVNHLTTLIAKDAI